MMKKTCILAAAAALLLGSNLSAERVWQKITEGEKTSEYWSERSVVPDGDTVRIEGRSESGTETTILRADGEAIKYGYNGKKGNIVMERASGSIRVTGTYGEKKLDATVKTGGAPWYGSAEQGLFELAGSGKDKVPFLMIDPDKTDKPIEMQYIRAGEELVGGIKTIKVKMCPTGIAANFWSAWFWIDETGKTIKYEGNRGPGTAKMTVQYLRTE
jgi:hypothetical protein